MKENSNSEIAFKDFKSSVSVLEFESVLETANEEYNKLKRVLKSKQKFDEKASESMKQMNEQANSMPPGLLEKLIKGLSRRAESDVLNQFGDEIRRHVPITDFINRFRTSDNQLTYLDFNYKIDKDGNI